MPARIDTFVYELLACVFDDEGARAIVTTILEEMRVAELDTPDALQRFGAILRSRGEEDLGRLIVVHAVRLRCLSAV